MNKCAFCLRFAHKDYTFIWFKIHMSISSKNGYRLTFFPKANYQSQFIYFLSIRFLITIQKWASIDVSISTSVIDPWLDFGFWMFTYLFVVYRWYLLTQTACATIQSRLKFPLAGLKGSQCHPTCSYISLVMYEMNNSKCLCRWEQSE